MEPPSLSTLGVPSRGEDVNAPGPGPARGQAMKWIVWGNVTLAEAAGRLAESLPSGSEGAVQEGSQDIEAARASSALDHKRALDDLTRCFEIMEDALRQSPYFLKDYSLVDTHLQVLVQWIGMMGVDLAPYPYVTTWLERINERPSLKALMASQM